MFSIVYRFLFPKQILTFSANAVLFTYLLGKYFCIRRKDLFVEYEDLKVKELFDDLNDIRYSGNLMRKKAGAEITKAVKKRYNQIVAFSNFEELLNSGLGKPEAMEGNLKGYYSLRVSANYRLIVRPITDDLSIEKLKECDTVIVKGVTDYHGKNNKHNWIIP
ncbi:MAG: type II toxin-antitoxin system YoeB family toxin [Clostridiales bacterium]|nr:type II toxin-antitoxin system YoeB family toxin [Clostridiales bacterium]